MTGSSISATNGSAVWLSAGAGNASLLLRQGAQAPGLAAGTTIDNLLNAKYPFAFQVLDSGKAALVAPTLSGTTQGNVALYGPATGTLQALAASGQAWPTGSGSWSKANPPELITYENGRIAIRDPYFSAFSSIWAGSSAASLNLVLKSGQTAGGILIQGAGAPQIATSGKVTLIAGLPNTDPFADNSQVGYFVSSGSNITSLIKYHDPAPGFAAGTLVANPSGEYTNPSGAYVVTGTTTTSDSVVWKGNLAGGAITKVFSKSDFISRVPGATTCTLSQPLITTGGQIFVSVQLTGTSNVSGLWTGTSAADLKLLIRAGDHMPGGAGSYGGVSRFINSAGQVLFPFNNHYGLAGYDPSLGIVPLVKIGDVVEIAPNVKRTIAGIGVDYDTTYGLTASYNDGLPSPLNDRGQVVFTASFTDNTQAILTTRIPVAGDTNQDGIVDRIDLGTLQSHFGKPGTRADGDFNGDGLVGFKDFQMLEANYGRTPPGLPAAAVNAEDLIAAEQSVPEPSAMSWIAIVGSSFLCRRRRI